MALCLCIAGKRPRHETFDGIELANERRDFLTRDRPAVGDVAILPFRVRPTVRQGEAGAIAREHLIHGEAVDHGEAPIPGQHLTPLGR